MMPYAAGGPGDTITRIIGAGMTKVLGKQFLVENVAGAGGTIGTAKVAAATPGDGYYLLIMHLGHAANSALYPNLRYDPVKDFEPIGMFAESPMAIVAKKDFPAERLQDFPRQHQGEHKPRSSTAMPASARRRTSAGLPSSMRSISRSRPCHTRALRPRSTI